MKTLLTYYNSKFFEYRNLHFRKVKDTFIRWFKYLSILNLDLVKDDHLKKLITLYQKKENSNNSLDNHCACNSVISI
jgi:hypothetical protein